MPRLYILAGCNGAGKTTASYTFLPEILDCREFVNSDEFAKSLSPFNPANASVTASRYMLRRVEYLIGKGTDFSIETTLATRSLVGVIDSARAKGYVITILYLWVSSPEIAIQRVRDRVASGGHNIADDVLRRRYISGLNYLFSIYMPLCDRWMIADNSGPTFTLVAEGDKKRTIIKDDEIFRKIRKMIDSYNEG
ncbi:MAG: zeta toxin family protein [Bacteroidales bacterium]|nr:zeta toxin family protein [Bacteroidales bacterium]